MLTREKLVETVNGCLNLHLDPVTVPLHVGLKALGIDSLDVFNVLVALEALTEKKVPDEDVEKLSTLGDMLHYFS
jgi:acyl carrier protein